MSGEKWDFASKYAIVALSFCVALILYMVSIGIGPARDCYVKTVEPWYVQAPFGHYWVDIEGSMFGFDSDLRESYTIKYFENGELQSAYITSTDPNLHVYIVNSTDPPRLDIFKREYPRWDGTYYGYDSQRGENLFEGYGRYNLYLPNPELFGYNWTNAYKSQIPGLG